MLYIYSGWWSIIYGDHYTYNSRIIDITELSVWIEIETADDGFLNSMQNFARNPSYFLRYMHTCRTGDVFFCPCPALTPICSPVCHRVLNFLRPSDNTQCRIRKLCTLLSRARAKSSHLACTRELCPRVLFDNFARRTVSSWETWRSRTNLPAAQGW